LANNVALFHRKTPLTKMDGWRPFA
jgi:hypothetical protein